MVQRSKLLKKINSSCFHLWSIPSLFHFPAFKLTIFILFISLKDLFQAIPVPNTGLELTTLRIKSHVLHPPSQPRAPQSISSLITIPRSSYLPQSIQSGEATVGLVSPAAGNHPLVHLSCFTFLSSEVKFVSCVFT